MGAVTPALSDVRSRPGLSTIGGAPQARDRHPVPVLVTHIAPDAPDVPTSWPSDDAVRRILHQVVDTHQSAGIVAAWIDRGEPHVEAYGPANSDGEPIDSTTVFEIGSLTKVFVATVLADMVVKGEVALHDPVATLLPTSTRVPSRGGRDMTLLDLATHTSGLPRLPTNFAPRDPTNPFADYTADDLYAFLAAYELPRDIGAAYEYSNVGYGLLGHALALRARTSFTGLMSDRIFRPLGMANTGVGSRTATERMAQGHDGNGRAVAPWEFDVLSAAGALRSTTDDMLRFVTAALEPRSTPLGDAMTLAQASRRPAGEGSGVRVGLGWHILDRDGRTITWHNGQTGGFHSFLGLDHATGDNAVVLACSASNIDDIGLHIIDPRFAVRAPPPARTEVRVDATILDRYVGHYELAPGYTITITRNGDRLSAKATSQGTLELSAESETRFFLAAFDAAVTFVSSPEGLVTGLVLHQQGRDQPARRVE